MFHPQVTEVAGSVSVSILFSGLYERQNQLPGQRISFVREEAVRRRSGLGENFCQDHRGKVGNRKGKRILPCVEKAGDALQCLFEDIFCGPHGVLFTRPDSLLCYHVEERARKVSGQGVRGMKNCLNPDGKKIELLFFVGVDGWEWNRWREDPEEWNSRRCFYTLGTVNFTPSGVPRTNLFLPELKLKYKT